MTRSLPLAVAQLGPIARDEPRTSAVKRMIALLQKAEDAGSKLVVFPDLALTTFFPRWYFENQADVDAFFETDMPNADTEPLFDAAARAGIAFYLGYRFYSRFIAEKIYQLDPSRQTPAHTMRDDIDYIPTNRFVLWGHHFTTVAGAAPIVGPGIAVIWGWVPAFLWVVLGTILFSGVHDFGSIWASIRNKARSMGSLTGDVVSQRARTLFMIVIFLLLLMVNAVFAVVISSALTATPSSVIPSWSAIAVALVIGCLLYTSPSPRDATLSRMPSSA